jgi:hypothetical protein
VQDIGSADPSPSDVLAKVTKASDALSQWSPTFYRDVGSL